MTIHTIQEIQARLLEMADEKRREQSSINRSNLHQELKNQFGTPEKDIAEYFESLVE